MDAANIFPQKVAEIKITYKNTVKASDRLKITSSQTCFAILRNTWGDEIEYVESFRVILLNRANQMLGVTKISEGGTSGCIVDPKRIFQTALKANASSIILSHNHPSSNLQPSEADKMITKKVKDAGILLEISVVDHLILTNDDYFSFADNGLL